MPPAIRIFSSIVPQLSGSTENVDPDRNSRTWLKSEPGSDLELNLEVVSKCSVESSGEDDGGGELGEGEVELGSSFPAGGDAAVVVEP
jgi:hypothetical protein